MQRLLVALLLALLAGCARPPASAYVGGVAKTADGTALGRNAAGEACTGQPAGTGGIDIFCGNWTEPSAHVERGGAAAPVALAGLAAASPWRSGLDARFACNAPQATSILGGVPTELLACKRRVGGWPQLALVASIDGRAYYGDGVEPTLPVMQRAIGVLSGRLAADAAPPPSQADALMASRLAAQAFSSGDVGQYERLMVVGTRANLAESFGAAEEAYRAALTLQRKALGRDNPDTVDALMSLALQISDQGRYAEADDLFREADRLAPRASDPVAPARLAHYEALNDLNQGRYPEALAHLRTAERDYAALLPASTLAPRPAAATRFAAGGVAGLADLPSEQDLVADPARQSALLGVIETRRYEAIVLRDMGKPAESARAIESAVALAAAHGLRQPILTARLYRTAGETAGRAGRRAAALAGLSQSADDFDLAQPNTRPVAQTELLQAGQLAGHDDDAALVHCRSAVALLRRLRVGARGELLAPCLSVYADEAAHRPAEQQALLGEMFAAAQLAQGSVTSRQIAEATARLAENARDPRVGAAIRRRQDAQAQLDLLYRQRAAIAETTTGAAGGVPSPEAASLDRQIAQARSTFADADAALQAASPNYGQLVQQVVDASDVLAALGPGEAFANVTLTDAATYTLLLRDGHITLGRAGLGEAAVTTLVARTRAGIEPTTTALPRFDVAAATALYTDTIGTVAPVLAGATSLIVAPAAPLLALPFEVLLTGPASADQLAAAPWLVRRYAIAHVPAAANFVSLRRVANLSQAAQAWFGFGDFKPVTLAQAERSFPGATCADSARLFAGLPPLPFSIRELGAARALLDAPADDQLLGASFTAAAVRAEDLKRYRVLHFATHALLPSELRCESQPAIVTSAPAGATNASGALLTAGQITGLDLDADLVILSACNSGGSNTAEGGGGTGGESLSGLARSFFYAGARALMVTHWSVNDQAAALIVAETLRRLRSGHEGPAAALRDAELALLDGAGHGMPAEIAHPFYWAPFALIGEGRGRITAAAIPIAPQHLAGL